MHLCYMDESGTPDVPGNTSHFVLVGVSIPAWHWRGADNDITRILSAWDLGDAELHTAWMLRKYLEQKKIPNFENMGRTARRTAVLRERTSELLRLQKQQNPDRYKQAKKTYKHTDSYIHLTLSERITVVQQIADRVGNWGFCRLFAESIDKVHFDPNKTVQTISEQAFTQIVSRFEQYLKGEEESTGQRTYGMLVHDNNETVAHKHTEMMRLFQRLGTRWHAVDHIMETPLFVDSRLTRMVQVADLCSYAIRRYAENNEADLFNRIFSRAHRLGTKAVGTRHFTNSACACSICVAHR